MKPDCLCMVSWVCMVRSQVGSRMKGFMSLTGERSSNASTIILFRLKTDLRIDIQPQTCKQTHILFLTYTYSKTTCNKTHPPCCVVLYMLVESFGERPSSKSVYVCVCDMWAGSQSPLSSGVH